MKVSEKEIQAVCNLAPFDRYQYFIKRVADSERMYSLVDNNGDYAISDVDESVLFSVWSAPEFAQMCIQDGWKDFQLKEITIEEFEDKVIDEIEQNGLLINVFPVGNKSGFVVDLNEFARDLSEEMKKYH